tara:strand:- start:1758 stop:2384 length:627 start_codon:yes stop_codon:yes gene_type:complete
MSNYQLFQNDLPKNILKTFKTSISIDTETMGLVVKRDRLCLIQIKNNSDDKYYILQITDKVDPKKCQNLKTLLENKKILKIFHFARFDLAVIKQYLNINVNNVFCTKIASKLARTYTNKHGLKDLISEFLKIDIDKKEQSSNWGSKRLTKDQIQYALNDVKYLDEIYKVLNFELKKKSLSKEYKQILSFLETRVTLDLMGWDFDIYAH